MITSNRYDLLYQWVNKALAINKFEALRGDASARRYFRVYCNDANYIAVDAPPEHEKNLAFVSIAAAFADQGLHVPKVLDFDLDSGFLLLSDLGDDQLLNKLCDMNVDGYYQCAFESLVKVQSIKEVAGWQLPLFDQTLYMTELARFHDWFLKQHLDIALQRHERQMLDNCYEALIASAIRQPQVCVHRDYHSRNLMILEDNQLGLLDFQDAVLGPISYDLVSLLRDCYIAWPIDKVYGWVHSFWLKLTQAPDFERVSEADFIRWFDLMGLQRHLKVLGIFARLYRRDNKPGYLKDLPRIMNYVLFVCQKYPEFEALQTFLEKRVMYESNDISGGSRKSTTAIDR